jgi:hypothetical protein
MQNPAGEEVHLEKKTQGHMPRDSNFIRQPLNPMIKGRNKRKIQS